MEELLLSWLILAAVSPLAGILLTWALFVCHTYRKKWRTLDLFLVGILVANLITCILLFSYALLHLLAPDTNIPHVCALFIWGLTSARTVQVTILASMVVDRALTVRWPYRYRFSVRRNQVRYHLSVLGVIAIFVGVAAIFARTPELNVTPQQCSVLPFKLNRKFAIFIICLQGACLLTHLICAMDIQIYFCHSNHRPLSFMPDLRASTPSLFCEGRRFGGLHKGRNASRRPYGADKTNSDIRWPTVMAVTGIAYIINHLPYLITTVMVTFFLSTSTHWLDNGAAWVAVGEALLLPFILCMSDSLHFSALVKIFHGPNPAKLDYLDHEDGKFPYTDELTETKVIPRNLFVGNPILSVGEPGSPGYHQHGTKHANSLQNQSKLEKNFWADFLPYHGPFYGTILETNDQALHIPAEPVYSDPLAKSNASGDKLKMRDNDHIYATLSEKCGSLSSLSDNSSSVGSIAADDDFEFHNTCAHAGEVKLKVHPDGKTELEYSSQLYPFQESAQDTISSQATTASMRSESLEGNEWTNESDGSSENDSLHRSTPIDSGTYRIHRSMPFKKLNSSKGSRMPRKFTKKLKQQSSSLSMNDLDQIQNQTFDNEDDEEIMYVLPVRSESTLSLYRIYFEENQNDNKILTKAISDGNLHYQSEKELNNNPSEKAFTKDSLEKYSRSSSGKNLKNTKPTQKKEQARYHLKSLKHNTNQAKAQENHNNKNSSKQVKSNHRRMLKVSFLNKNGSKHHTVTLRDPQISSVDDFLHILDRAKFSYLDNGDLCWHYIFDGNEPEIKKIFVTDYL